MIRPMLKQDLLQVVNIEQQVQSFPWSQQQFADCLEQAYPSLLMLDQQQVVAYLLWLPTLDEIEILTLAVAPSHQRQGRAQALLLQLKQQAQAQQIQRLILEVAASNQAALALYQRLGFEQIGVRRAYYRYEGKQDDAWVMALTL